jgi:hypothetical protein
MVAGVGVWTRFRFFLGECFIIRNHLTALKRRRDVPRILGWLAILQQQPAASSYGQARVVSMPMPQESVAIPPAGFPFGQLPGLEIWRQALPCVLEQNPVSAPQRVLPQT